MYTTLGKMQLLQCISYSFCGGHLHFVYESGFVDHFLNVPFHDSARSIVSTNAYSLDYIMYLSTYFMIPFMTKMHISFTEWHFQTC